MRWAGRILLLGVGCGVGAVVVQNVESAYTIHEQEIATRPIFDPPGLKYAQVVGPERGAIRGWVAGMSPPTKRPGVRRVLAVGDSLTWGLGVRREQAWPAVLERRLTNTEVFNLGMCGYDAEQGVSLITHHLGPWQPDLVVWATYTNDVDPTFLMFGAHDEHPVCGDPVPSLRACSLVDLASAGSAQRHVQAGPSRQTRPCLVERPHTGHLARVVRRPALRPQAVVGEDRCSCAGACPSRSHAGRTRALHRVHR